MIRFVITYPVILRFFITRINSKNYFVKSLQGISGILADEMGLGKTVQSIAFLCHVAERYCKYLQQANLPVAI